MILEHEATPEEVWDSLGGLAEIWGGSLDRSGEEAVLNLTVQHGLRRGLLTARVNQRSPRELEIVPLDENLQVQRGAVVLLLFSMVGALALVAWPFFPRLGPLMPMALVMAVAGWMLGVARLRTRGLNEFVETLSKTLVLE